MSNQIEWCNCRIFKIEAVNTGIQILKVNEFLFYQLFVKHLKGKTRW